MIKKLLAGLILAAFISSCFAGYSSGGRSGFSGGSRSFSSSSVSRSSGFSSGRSGYSRPIPSVRTYAQPRPYQSSRSYAGSSANTTIHNNHYSHGGYGGGLGGGFFSGMLGGYMGASMAGNHGTTVVAAGGAPMMGEGQGMLVEGAAPYRQGGGVLSGLFSFAFIMLIICGVIAFIKYLFDNSSSRSNRW